MKAIRRRALVKDILWILATLGLVAAIFRFSHGLGAATALNDATPWGFWIGFDVMAGVALAAGGFTIAAIVYIFHLEKYHPLLRPAILTALLGYGAAIVGLMCDLGLPWHTWRIANWQDHSVLFEVGWCVILYTTVLALEFSPAILEHAWFQSTLFRSVAGWLKRLTLPLVIVGITLSTLHQSSLGSLFLLMPFRLHPLWYSPIQPLLFFVSAIGLGLMMVTLEGFVSAYLFDHPVKLDLYNSLGRAAAWVLWLYLALRLGDLAVRGILPGGLDGSWQSALFMFEVGITMLLPAILLSIRAVRTSRAGLLTAAGLTVCGVVLNRLDVGFIAIFRPAGVTYFPSWPELAVSLGIIAGAGLVFIFFTENLKVIEGMPAPAPTDPFARPTFDPHTKIHWGQSLLDTTIRRSAMLVPVIALAVFFLPAGSPRDQLRRTPVEAAHGWELLVMRNASNNDMVEFDHLGHQARLQETTANETEVCQTCHHLSKPNDEDNGCWECHRDMYRPTSIFDHTLHQVKLGGNASCEECHQGEHTAATAKPCAECHAAMVPAAGETRFNDLAPGYKDALHGACLPCHQQEAEAQNKPELSRCPACHKFKGETTSPQVHVAEQY
jgi:Ni/Fe-hydrogenase subunit HybB-like protein